MNNTFSNTLSTYSLLDIVSVSCYAQFRTDVIGVRAAGKVQLSSLQKAGFEPTVPTFARPNIGAYRPSCRPCQVLRGVPRYAQRASLQRTYTIT